MTARTRRIVVSFVAALASAWPAFAQAHGFGIKAGVDLATLRVTPQAEGSDRQWLTGFVAGGFYTRPLVSRLELQVEGVYAAKGARLRISGLTEKVQVDYFDVPILVRARFGRYYVEGGASAALRLRARARITFVSSTESVDIADEVERADYGAVAGAGVQFGRYLIDGRLTQGLKDIDADKADASHTKNRAFAITGGVRF
jgi:hypothetical protein